MFEIGRTGKGEVNRSENLAGVSCNNVDWKLECTNRTAILSDLDMPKRVESR